MKAERTLPLHLTENTESKCFVFRHPKNRGKKSVFFYYSHGKDREEIRQKAIKFTKKTNGKLPLPSPTSIEDRMSSRNTSNVVGVNPAKHFIHRKTGAEYTYYLWKANWVGCPHTGGVTWPCKTHGCKKAYGLAVLTRKMRTINRGQILEEFEKVRGTSLYRAIISKKPIHKGCEN